MENLELQQINANIEKEISRIATNLVLSKLTKNDLEQICSNALDSITKRESDKYYNNRKQMSKLECDIAVKFYEDVNNHIAELRNSDEWKEKVRKEAEDLLEELRNKVRENLINNIASQLSVQTLDMYGGVFDMKVQEIVNRMLGGNRY